MKLIINGDEQEIVLERPTLAGLLAVRRPRPPFAVEVNKTHVRRPQYDATPLKEGDRVEIVTLVGGG